MPFSFPKTGCLIAGICCGDWVFLALPLLDCMKPLFAENTKRPRRSVFIYLPNGVNTYEYQMPTAGADYQMSKPLQALSKHRDVITRSVACTIHVDWGIITIAAAFG